MDEEEREGKRGRDKKILFSPCESDKENKSFFSLSFVIRTKTKKKILLVIFTKKNNLFSKKILLVIFTRRK